MTFNLKEWINKVTNIFANEKPSYVQFTDRNTADSTTTTSTTGAVITSVTHTSKTGLVFVFGQATLKTSANTTRLSVFRGSTNVLTSVTNNTASTPMVVAGVVTSPKGVATTFTLNHIPQSGATSTLIRYQQYRIVVVDIPTYS